MRKVDFDVQRVVDFRSTRSLSDGGRIGFRAGVSQAFSKRIRPSPQTTPSCQGTAQGVCVSCELRLTKGAYTKRERVCQRGDKATPALVRKAGVESENDVHEEKNYRRWLSSIESSDVYPKRYGIPLVSMYSGRFRPRSSTTPTGCKKKPVQRQGLSLGAAPAATSV